MNFCRLHLPLALIAVSAYSPVRAEAWRGQARASSGQDAYVAGHAVDGDPGTRWSSQFTDVEWWQFQFDEPREIGGLRIRWETAFGEKYRIETSDDGANWLTVFEEDEGDGQTDVIFFAPVTCRFLRLYGLQRGTGWGYSIWEMELFESDQVPVLTATAAQSGQGVDLAMDGKPTTAWASEGAGEQSVDIALPEPMALGGMELHWNEPFARRYRLEGQGDAGDWQALTEVERGDGGRDYVFFPSTKTRGLRIRCLESSGAGYHLAEIKLKGGEEHATPIRQYAAAARESRPGLYPRWLLREQEFWTTVGQPDDDEEALLGETGTFEPFKGGFSVMPFLRVGTRGPWVTWSDVTLEQSLQERYLPQPTVRWETESWRLDITALVARDTAGTFVRYRVSNFSSGPLQGQLALAVRPVQINPQWQYGGFSAIRQVAGVVDDPIPFLEVNGRKRVICATPPSRLAVVPWAQGDVLDHFARDGADDADEGTDEAGMLSAGLLYDLDVPPGETQAMVVFFPLDEEARIGEDVLASPVTAFARMVSDEMARWKELLSEIDVSLPEGRLLDVLKSNVAYILINQDGPWIKPGPRNYDRSWMRDGSETGVALLRMGLVPPVRSFLEAYLTKLPESGWVPWLIHADGAPVQFVTGSREGHEYDSQGQFVFLVRHYLDMTGDETLARQAYPAAMRALRFAQSLRGERLTEDYRNDRAKQPCYGLLPESNSHEGYYPAVHSYWDDFWYLRGLKDGLHLAQRMDQPADIEWLRTEEAAFRQDLYTSIARVVARDGLEYIPGCVEKGDFDATSTAIAITACGEKDALPQPLVHQTFDRYFSEFEKRLVPGGAVSFTPYEVRSAEAFVRLGQRDRALKMLRHFVEDSARPRAWNHFAEVVHGRPRTPSYIGDMPHTWVGSGYISAVRSLLVFEDADALVLAAGADPAWLPEGVTVRSLPTLFGPVSYSLKQDGEGVLKAEVSGDAAPPGGFRLVLPELFAGWSLETEDVAAALDPTGIAFRALPFRALLRAP